MAILAECPVCHEKLSARRAKCTCGEDLHKARKAGRVNYLIDYRVRDGKVKDGKPTYIRRREFVGPSLEEARDAEGKRKGQKRENTIFDEILPEVTMTYKELAGWYLDLEKVKGLSSFGTVQTYINKFISVFGERRVKDIKPLDLENLQGRRKREGLKSKTIDDELNYAKGMIIKAFDNDMISGKTLKTFRQATDKHHKMLKGHSNRRQRILSAAEYEALHAAAPKHLQDILTIGYWTGMRKGEIIGLTWDRVDLKGGFIHLAPEDTKEGQAKTIPIGSEVKKVLDRIPRPIKGGNVFLYTPMVPMGHGNGSFRECAGRTIEKRFETAMKSACEKAGILWGRDVQGGFIFHDLRHTFITEMRRAGVPRTVTMSITGHAIRDMNERYDTVEEWEKTVAIKKLEIYRASGTEMDSEKPKVSEITG